MANGSKRGGGGGDVVLESRHLVGLFVLMVVIFGVVFLLGYELGRNQYDGHVRAASLPQSVDSDDSAGVGTVASAKGAISTPSTASRNAALNPAPGGSPPSNYDSYTTSQPIAPKTRLNNTVSSTSASASSATKTAKPTATVSAKAATAKSQPAASASAANAKTAAASVGSPLIPKGALVLQVSALTKESDALALAQVLQQKKFPAYVLMPGADNFYHVQVGPYANAKAADTAQKALEEAGFKPIVKR
jgi:cell division septation protein DedD